MFQTATVVYFYSNQMEITEKYCENKAQPEKKCHGKCHLNKQLNIDRGSTKNQQPESVQQLSFWLYGLEIISSFNFEIDWLSNGHTTFYKIQQPCDEFTSKFVPPDNC